MKHVIYLIIGWTFIIAGLLKAGELCVDGNTLSAFILAAVMLIFAGFLVSKNEVTK